ncbi:uncharacterized protein LOC121367932 [Gigantopelta aegis]|uniref:uncharacterized protein LOC121367932 n=1 Tax=Gigantopelta aegis TaxID=1735272 RepID=UPI001B88A7B5|nr:uncharacterized protein LOC121367932 [Gigantopelta aegis]
MAGSRKQMRLKCVEDVNKIKDFPEALMIMRDLGISGAGLKNLDEAKKNIASWYNAHGDNAKSTYVKKDQDALNEALNEDKRNRASLLKVFEQAEANFKELPEKFVHDLDQVFPGFQADLKRKSQELQKSDCAILFAGETGSGKSSLVNLLSGANLLPTAGLQCTATMCELRKSPKKYAVIHSRQRKKSTPKILDCGSNEGEFIKKLHQYITFIDEETEESPYDRVEIFWPFPSLEECVVFVDSPGVGQSQHVFKQIEKYMTKAFGFIYVINPGSIHKDRLGYLLRMAVQQSDFDPSTTIFVNNKWDQVPPREQEDVFKYTLEKLNGCIPGTQPSQIYPLSTKEAVKTIDFGGITKEHVELVKGIRGVLPITFHSKLCTYYRWMASILKRLLCSLKISRTLSAKSKEEKEKTFQHIQSQIGTLEEKAEYRIFTMRNDLKHAIEDIVSTILKMIQQPDYKRRLMAWDSSMCPAPDSTKKVLNDASSKLTERLAHVVDIWEHDNDVVSGVKSRVLKTFNKELELFEDQIKKIEGVLFGDDGKALLDLHKSMRRRTTVKPALAKGKKKDGKDDGLLSMGNAVAAAASLDVKNSKYKTMFKSYDKSNAPSMMMAAMDLFLKDLNRDAMADKLNKFFERFSKNIDQVSKIIPEFLKADRKLMQAINQDLRDDESMLKDLYPALITRIDSLQGRLDIVFAKQLMRFEFNYSEFKYDTKNPVGVGSFASVFVSDIQTQGESIPVALKICREPLRESNVNDVLLEDRMLRDLRHKNFIRYYGASHHTVGSDMRWIMVLEFCPSTLKQRFVGEDVKSPAKQGQFVSLQLDSMKKVASFAEQVCCGLQYLHNKGLVHRDMKLENILLTGDDVVKLTDVGLAKRAIDIAGTLAGTPVYMAPEILLQKGRYDFKADIYSMAVILWEMWYGMDAADHIQGQLFGTFESAISTGLRPSLTMNDKPPADWVNFIKVSWSLDPNDRPDVDQMLTFFRTFLKQTSK